MEQVKHLQIKNGKVFSNTKEKPEHPADMCKRLNIGGYDFPALKEYQSALQQWEQESVEVGNPDFITDAYSKFEIPIRYAQFVNGIYPCPSNLFCEVREEEFGHVDDYSKPHGFKKVSILSFQEEVKKELTVQAVVDWMNTWEQLRGTAIPIRFMEDFLKQNNQSNSHNAA